ncbi:MAG: hypothetical protein ACRDGJ_11530, partial [Candidatus Limnocylindria bacterium]
MAATGPDEQSPFLDPTPAHWAARSLAWLLLAVFVAVVVAAVAVTLPETISSPFVLVPGHGADPIRAPRAGVVVAVRVIEGARLSPGDVTFAIRSATVGDRAAELRGLETQLGGTEDGRANARQRYEGQRRADEEEARRLTARVAHLGNKLDEQQSLRAVRETRYVRDLEIQGNDIEITLKELEYKRIQAATTRELAERLERAHRDGSISWLEYNNRKLEATKSAAEQQQLERALETARLRLSQLRAEHESWAIEWKLTVAGLESDRQE